MFLGGVGFNPSSVEPYPPMCVCQPLWEPLAQVWLSKAGLIRPLIAIHILIQPWLKPIPGLAWFGRRALVLPCCLP